MPLLLKVQFPTLITEPFNPYTPTPEPLKLIVAFPPSKWAFSPTIAATLPSARLIVGLSAPVPSSTLLSIVVFAEVCFCT